MQLERIEQILNGVAVDSAEIVFNGNVVFVNTRTYDNEGKLNKENYVLSRLVMKVQNNAIMVKDCEFVKR